MMRSVKNCNNGLLIECAAVACFMLLFLNIMKSLTSTADALYISTALRTIQL